MMSERPLTFTIEEIAGEYLAIVYPCPHTRTVLRVPAQETPAGPSGTVYDHQIGELVRRHFAECYHCGMDGMISGDLAPGTLRHNPGGQKP